MLACHALLGTLLAGRICKASAHALILGGTIVRFILVVSVILAALVPASASGQAADFPIAGGRFFTQTGGGAGRGYAVTDDGGFRFWSEFQRFGGVQAVGYPASQRFEWDGFTVQVFQRVAFQWRPECSCVYFVNVFDRLGELGKNQFLLDVRQTPLPRPFPEDAGQPWERVVQNHLAVMEAYPAIKAKYYDVVGDPIQANGLPVSNITDMGNHFALRAQRVVFQQWKEDVPWARRGEVTVALGGDITKEAGVLPNPAALQPITPATGGAPAAAASPAPAGFIEIGNPITAAVNSDVRVMARAAPSTQCSIRYVTPAGTVSSAVGLEAKTVDANGIATWTWTIGPGTRLGQGSVAVTCSGQTRTSTITIG